MVFAGYFAAQNQIFFLDFCVVSFICCTLAIFFMNVDSSS